METSDSSSQLQNSNNGLNEAFENADVRESKTVNFNQYSICALSITTVIGGQYYGWNKSLCFGFGTYAVGQALMAAAYLVYVASIAEIVSGFPFSGGGYGLARVAQGYWIGFLVGCCEALEYIAYSAMSFLYVANVICDVLDIDSKFSVIFCCLCYVVTVILTNYGERLLPFVNYILAVLSIAILLIFCLGMLHWVDFDSFASLHESSSHSRMSNWFKGGVPAFLSVLPATTAAYGGIEALCLLPAFTDSPKRVIPRGLLMGWSALFVTNVLVVFVMASMPGGIDDTCRLALPMGVGFGLMFKLSRIGTMLLMIPAQFSMGYGFVLPYSKLLQSLGTTNLLPSMLQLNRGNSHHNAAIVGSMFGFVICCICEYWDDQYLPHICMLAGFLTYLSQLHGYYMLKTKFSTIAREFTSPFGLIGVAFATIVFLLGIVSILGFVGDYVTVTFMGIFLIVLSVYYHIFGARTQTIAKEEQAVLFQLHVAKGNQRKKQLHHHKPSRMWTTFSKNKVAPTRGTSASHPSFRNKNTKLVSPEEGKDAVSMMESRDVEKC